MKKIIIALLGMTIVVPSVFAANTWYVSPSGNNANSGATWALAKKTIQGGVDVASAGDTVLVTSGTYVLANQVEVDIGITVKSVNGASLTVVNGNSAHRCFFLHDANAILDGFTITGGYDSSYSGGVQNNGTVQNCTISGNAGYHGGGVYNSGLVQNCTILGNTSSFHGGGVWNDGIIQNCMISGNISFYDGGGVWNDGIILNCTISKNTSDSGGAGGGMFNYQGIVQNCIVYYNENGDFSDQAGSYAPQYSCAPGLSGNGNTTDDPQFVDSAGGNYRLQATSPCINAGINQDWMANAVDLDGNPRIIDGRVDMGTYECITPQTVIGPVIKANGQTYNATVNHSGNLSITVQINPGQYSLINVDWWVVARAGSSWYYLNNSFQWAPEGNLLKWHPVYQGGLFNLPATEVLNITGLATGLYTFYFAVDYPMDGILNLDGPILVDSVNVAVQ